MSVALTLFLCVTSGCGRPPSRPDRAIVSGSVSYQGQALPGGVVTFISASDGDETASCVLMPDGTYLVADAPLGETRITIDTQTIRAGAADRFVEIPAKYNAANTSGLTHTVQQGENSGVDFKLE